MNTVSEKEQLPCTIASVSGCSIQFERKFSMKNGNKVTKKNWHKVIAISSSPCTNVHGVRAIDAAIAKDGVYYEKWELKYEESKGEHDRPSGYIFREVNHGGGISGRHKTFKQAIWSAISPGRIKVLLPE